MLTVSTKEEAKRLIRSELNFGLTKKSIAYFQEADPRTIYYKYCGIGHDKPDIYKDRLLIYIIYGKDHNINNYKYNIMTYKTQKRRRYLHDLVKYENYISISWENKY